jgi:hypothetical protein
MTDEFKTEPRSYAPEGVNGVNSLLTIQEQNQEQKNFYPLPLILAFTLVGVSVISLWKP